MKKTLRIGSLIFAILISGGLTLQAVTDTEPPKIVITSPVDDGLYFLNEPVFAVWEVTDPEPSSGLDFISGTTLSGRPIETRLVGPTSYNVVARDNNGNLAFETVDYTVIYRVQAMEPILQQAFDAEEAEGDPRVEVQVGQAVQFKFSVQDFFNEVVANVSGVISVVNAETKVIVPIEDDVIAKLRLDEESGIYQYVLNTTNIPAGEYIVFVQFNDQETTYRFELALN